MTSIQEDIENCTKRLLEKQRLRLNELAARAKRQNWPVFSNDPGYPEEHFRQICTAEAVHGREKIELGRGRKKTKKTRMKSKTHKRRKKGGYVYRLRKTSTHKMKGHSKKNKKK